MRNIVGTTLVVSATLAVAAACAWLAVKAAVVVVMLFIAAIAASAMAPLGHWVAGIAARGRWRISPAAGLGMAYALVALLAAAALWSYGLAVAGDVRALAQQAPHFYAQALAALDALKARYVWLPDPRVVIGDLQSESAFAGAVAQRFIGLTLGAAGFAAAAVTTLVISFYLAIDAPRLEAALLRTLPQRHRSEVRRRLRFVGGRFGAWVRGQMLVAFIMGSTTTLAMAALGMPYPFFIGGIVALTDLVPLLGGTLGAIPAIAIALFQPRWQLVAVIAFFIVLQQLENNVLIPRIMSKAVHISPVVTIIALLVGGTAFGLIGAFVAVPLAAALQVFAPFAVRIAKGQYRALDAA